MQNKTGNITLFSYRATQRLKREAEAHRIPVDRLVALLMKQLGRCSICNRPLIPLDIEGNPFDIELDGWLTKAPGKPRVDYCPNTGVIRGILCEACFKAVVGETSPYAACKQLPSTPKAQQKAAKVMEYFAAIPTGRDLISWFWEPDPLNRT